MPGGGGVLREKAAETVGPLAPVWTPPFSMDPNLYSLFVPLFPSIKMRITVGEGM